jgi:DEAD/DEAH box helicase
MSAENIPTALELSEWLRHIRTCSGDGLSDLVSVLGLRECLPSEFLGTLNENDLTICYQASIICYGVTGSIQVPCKMQLNVILSNSHGKDTLVSAGTGSGKTLPIALNVLLDDTDKQLLTLMLSPLKHLQMTQEFDFNSHYGIPTVVINEDMPREDSWWTVTTFCLLLSSHFDLTCLQRRTSGIKRLILLDALGSSL